MMTERPHPRYAAGLARAPRAGLRVDSWIKLNCGDLVTERGGRHVGRVEAIIDGATVRVRWLESRWLTDLELADVERA
jgi:hypothetical protein